mmetsp:Transcript_33428/g.68381  ORF Transcript_33428/g.68381 Transcript_33428/m.68381 type:complete len:205 (+) Transcript_33428:180-794(+)
MRRAACVLFLRVKFALLPHAHCVPQGRPALSLLLLLWLPLLFFLRFLRPAAFDERKLFDGVAPWPRVVGDHHRVRPHVATARVLHQREQLREKNGLPLCRHAKYGSQLVAWSMCFPLQQASESCVVDLVGVLEVLQQVKPPFPDGDRPYVPEVQVVHGHGVVVPAVSHHSFLLLVWRGALRRRAAIAADAAVRTATAATASCRG